MKQRQEIQLQWGPLLSNEIPLVPEKLVWFFPPVAFGEETVNRGSAGGRVQPEELRSPDSSPALSHIAV